MEDPPKGDDRRRRAPESQQAKTIIISPKGMRRDERRRRRRSQTPSRRVLAVPYISGTLRLQTESSRNAGVTLAPLLQTLILHVRPAHAHTPSECLMNCVRLIIQRQEPGGENARRWRWAMCVCVFLEQGGKAMGMQSLNNCVLLLLILYMIYPQLVRKRFLGQKVTINILQCCRF